VQVGAQPGGSLDAEIVALLLVPSGMPTQPALQLGATLALTTALAIDGRRPDRQPGERRQGPGGGVADRCEP